MVDGAKVSLGSLFIEHLMNQGLILTLFPWVKCFLGGPPLYEAMLNNYSWSEKTSWKEFWLPGLIKSVNLYVNRFIYYDVSTTECESIILMRFVWLAIGCNINFMTLWRTCLGPDGRQGGGNNDHWFQLIFSESYSLLDLHVPVIFISDVW